MDREPEPWESNRPAPFLTIGSVGVQSLGRGRFLLVAPDEERIVEGFEPARQLSAKALEDAAARRRAAGVPEFPMPQSGGEGSDVAYRVLVRPRVRAVVNGSGFVRNGIKPVRRA